MSHVYANDKSLNSFMLMEFVHCLGKVFLLSLIVLEQRNRSREMVASLMELESSSFEGNYKEFRRIVLGDMMFFCLNQP